ncbi:MAG: shikimate dehydrogenase, partial [Betaproteobacteria bacterium]|nr:shikimate dehydrogenase [Betaproteobacteria bacterium]
MKEILAGLIGAGIQRSRSPALHEREAKEQGLSLTYELLDLDKLGVPLPQLLADAKRRGFAGLNITYPCKQEVIPLLDELSTDARSLNAVNTVVIRGGRLTGHNTDWSGFAEGFRRGLPGAKLDRVVQLGAGGAGAAIAHAARKLGVGELTIFDIDHARGAELGASVEATVEIDLAGAMARADGLIHCTPTGMAK